VVARAPHSERFWIQKNTTAADIRVQVVVNWADQLRRLLPITAR
jgi:hypothetical protein